MNIAALRPSDITKLQQNGVSNEAAAEILAGIATMLQELRDDNGADADRIFTAGQILDQAQVWDHIDVEALATTLRSAPADTRSIFLQGLPRHLAEQISYELLTADPLVQTTRDALVSVAAPRARPGGGLTGFGDEDVLTYHAPEE